MQSTILDYSACSINRSDKATLPNNDSSLCDHKGSGVHGLLSSAWVSLSSLATLVKVQSLHPLRQSVQDKDADAGQQHAPLTLPSSKWTSSPTAIPMLTNLAALHPLHAFASIGHLLGRSSIQTTIMGTQLYRSEGPACVGESAIIVGGCPTAPGRGIIQAVRPNGTHLGTRDLTPRMICTHSSSWSSSSSSHVHRASTSPNQHRSQN